MMLLIIYFVMWYLLVILAVLFALSAIDDLFIDFWYWTRYFRRLWKTRHYKPLTYEMLVAKPEQRIAVLVPCWHEADVIGSMLRQNCYSIDYDNYCLFVGVYPNDPDTIEAVQAVARENAHVHCVIGKKPGPTNKAMNLNGVYEYVKEYEKTLATPFDIFVFHDSEDVIHPLSFRLYNYLMPKNDMIQIPVFPLAVPYRKFTHWLYADEFAENHTKDIIVRETIRGHVPSAGVGTAFSSRALKLMENPETHTPFSTDSLTEDYRTSLEMRLLGLKQIFVLRQIERMQWKKRWFGRGYVLKPTKEYIATRALFPLEYSKAVRQKARWIIGIVFQEWAHTGWPKSWKLRFTLAHDRKGFVTHFINGFGYFVFAFWVFYSFFTWAMPEYPTLQEQLSLHPWVWWLIIGVTCVMIERMIQRAIAIHRVYQNWIPALLSIPRAFFGNILNLHALLRAYRVYYKAPKTSAPSKQPAWDKTEHHFPGSHLLTPYRRRLGDLLVEKGLISGKQLQDAILLQQQSGKRLGDILLRHGMISAEKLQETLSQQYRLSLFPESAVPKALQRCQETLPQKLIQWLLAHDVTPVEYDPQKHTLTLLIDDPTNELFLAKVMQHVAPLKVVFVLGQAMPNESD